MGVKMNLKGRPVEVYVAEGYYSGDDVSLKVKNLETGEVWWVVSLQADGSLLRHADCSKGLFRVTKGDNYVRTLKEP